MPEISRFLGIVIRMYFQDHNPPHFHVSYESFEASIDIENLKIIRGNIPPRIYGIVVEWASLHKKELIKNWKNAKNLKEIKSIKPLI